MSTSPPTVTIDVIEEKDLKEFLPLLQSYCQFYHETEGIPLPSDADLLFISRALINNPIQEGIQLLARHIQTHQPIGFATLLWNWSTLKGGQLAILEDLYVIPSYRGQGIADLIINECRQRSRDQGARCLTWQTSVKNHRAQAVYARCEGVLKSDRWLNYTIEL